MPDRSPFVGYEVLGQSPLVVLAEVDDHRLMELAQRLAVDFPDLQFIGIVSAREDDDVQAVLTALQALIAEVIFTASSSPDSVPGFDLATRALENGMGQDFVFTVPALADALRYGIDVLAEEPKGRWEGSAILVLGPTSMIDEARRVISPPPVSA